MNTPASILRFWEALELFSPQTVPEVNPQPPKAPVYRVGDDGLLPWEVEHPHQRRRAPYDCIWRHTVFVGVFALDSARQELEKRLGVLEENIEEGDEKFTGEAALFACECTSGGRPLFESLTFSSCAWAIARTCTEDPTNPNWLSGFDDFLNGQQSAIEELWKLPDDDSGGKQIADSGFPVGRPLQLDDFLAGARTCASKVGWSPSGSLTIRVRSTPVSKKKPYATDGNDFLNSFFLGDLRRIAGISEKGEAIGGLLEKYLRSPIDVQHTRFDVRTESSVVSDGLAPKRFPRGCWPAVGGHPLVLSQQLAVNELTARCAVDGGLFSINGPPGTGKSTLLRDVVAHVIVERARVLAQFTSPAAGIVGKVRLTEGRQSLYVPQWDARLLGHGIVVASSNNAAVNNITLELPAEGAIDARWANESNYFRNLATKLIEEQAWGLIAAKLGNKKNRQDFIGKLFFGKSDDDGVDSGTTNGSASGHANLFDYLKNVPEGPRWNDAVDGFKKALAIEDHIRSQRQQYWQAVSDHPVADRALRTARDGALAIREKIELEGQKVLEAQRDQEAAVSQVEQRRGDRLAHAAHKPSWWEWFIPWNRRPRVWATFDRQLAELERTACEELGTANKSLVLASESLQSLRIEAVRCDERVASAAEFLQKVDEQVASMKSSGLYAPDFSASIEMREKSAPWNDSVWHEARAQVFLTALTLHQAFIRENAEPFQRAVRGIWLVMSNQAADKAPPEAITATWEALFLIVPVISTAFASVERFFGRLPPQSLGWLLIDEAGQATPQAAVGAFWRSKRAVVVGDPLQLEPVVTIPLRLQEILRNHFKVTKDWMPSLTSVQERCDVVCPLGTTLSTAIGPVWIGSPLRVHRRCDNPMFVVANRIAYDDLMVFGTPKRPELGVMSSRWISVRSTDWDGHWSEDEGQRLLQLIQELLSGGVEPGNIFVITPFRRIELEIREIAKKWPGMRAGTIHTVQGREADVVIMILGGNPSRPKAREWAAEKPNLLNVAITRAKRRLYVIGDQAAWTTVPYFSDLSRSLRASEL